MTGEDGLRVRVKPAPDGDAAEVAELTGLLRTELLDLDMDCVNLPTAAGSDH